MAEPVSILFLRAAPLFLQTVAARSSEIEAQLLARGNEEGNAASEGVVGPNPAEKHLNAAESSDLNAAAAGTASAALNAVGNELNQAAASPQQQLLPPLGGALNPQHLQPCSDDVSSRVTSQSEAADLNDCSEASSSAEGRADVSIPSSAARHFRETLSSAVGWIGEDDMLSCGVAAAAVFNAMLTSACPEVKGMARGIMCASQVAAATLPEAFLVQPSAVRQRVRGDGPIPQSQPADVLRLIHRLDEMMDGKNVGAGRDVPAGSAGEPVDSARDASTAPEELAATAASERSGQGQKLDRLDDARTTSSPSSSSSSSATAASPSASSPATLPLHPSSSYQSYFPSHKSHFPSHHDHASAAAHSRHPIAPLHAIAKSISSLLPSTSSLQPSPHPRSATQAFSLAPGTPASSSSISSVGIPAPDSALQISSSSVPNESSSETEPQPPAFITVPIFFATNRNHTRSTYPPRTFGTSRGKKMSYGVSWISMPNVNRNMPLAEEKNGLWQFEESRKGAAKEKIINLTMTPIMAGSFFEVVGQAASESPEDCAVIYVHGFNTPMFRACQRLAQVVSAADFRGLALCYSWPSNESLAKYSADEGNCFASSRHFLDLLRDIRSSPGIRRIQILAHSMGARLVLNSLLRLPPVHSPQEGRQGSLPQLPPASDGPAVEEREAAVPVNDAVDSSEASIGQVVLGAPDFDLDEFVGAVADLAQRCRHITVYTSAEDQALTYSRSIHGGFPRLGDLNGLSSMSSSPFDGFIDVIDTTDQDLSFMGHSYIFDASSVISDCGQVLCYENVAHKREELKRCSFPNGLNYWKFATPSPSFPQRSMDSLRKGVANAANSLPLVATLTRVAKSMHGSAGMHTSASKTQGLLKSEENEAPSLPDQEHEIEDIVVEDGCLSMGDVMRSGRFDREGESLLVKDDSEDNGDEESMTAA